MFIISTDVYCISGKLNDIRNIFGVTRYFDCNELCSVNMHTNPCMLSEVTHGYLIFSVVDGGLRIIFSVDLNNYSNEYSNIPISLGYNPCLTSHEIESIRQLLQSNVLQFCTFDIDKENL